VQPAWARLWRRCAALQVCGEAHGGGSQHLLPAIFLISFICRDGLGRHDSFLKIHF